MQDARTTDPEQELRELIEERVAAVGAKDAGPLVARLADDLVMFDVLPPLRSRGAGPVREKMRSWFDGYTSDIGYEVHELDVRADDRLGFCSFVYHVTGTLQSGDDVDMWVRATLCCERVNGAWRIVHDHESVPFDPATGMAQISVGP